MNGSAMGAQNLGGVQLGFEILRLGDVAIPLDLFPWQAFSAKADEKCTEVEIGQLSTFSTGLQQSE